MDLRVNCATCHKRFQRTRGRIHEAKKEKWRSFCSRKCLYEAHLRGKKLSCGNPDCADTFYRAQAEISKVKKSYCSRSCAAIVNNRNKPKRIIELKRCANPECKEIISKQLIHCSKKCYTFMRIAYFSFELVQFLKIETKRLGRTVTKRELGPTAYMCIRAFGSWNKALISAGLEPHRSHSERMYKRTRTKALDGHKCDSISEAIIDNWLTKHNIPHERNAAYPDTNHKADWSISNGVFVEYFGLANDSPRYDQSIQQKRLLCKKNQIRLLEIYSSDLYPIVRLEQKFRDMIYSPR